eukprot:133960-Pyramimonas_sp.AAC.1
MLGEGTDSWTRPPAPAGRRWDALEALIRAWTQHRETTKPVVERDSTTLIAAPSAGRTPSSWQKGF